MKSRFSLLVQSVALPLLVGILASLLTRGGMILFEMLNKPPLSPPGWLFPVVWTILYILMGVAFYLVVQSGEPEEKIKRASFFYGLQLTVNFLWPILFFRFGLYGISFFWLILLWILVLVTIVEFGKISKTASYLMIPYLLWLTFAGYLNLGVWLLNGIM